MQILKVTLLSSALAFTACGKSNDDDASIDICERFKSENLSGEESNRAAMEGELAKQNLSGATSPSGYAWSIRKSEESYLLKIRESDYLLIFDSSSGSWRIKLAPADDQIFGTFTFFVYTDSGFVDKARCGSGGYLFNIVLGDKSESGRGQSR